MKRAFHARRPSAAMVIATAALFIALGGTGYAAFSLPRNSVGSRQLKTGAVTTNKIKNGAVTAKKINARGLTVPHALLANVANTANTASGANNANHATNADNATNATNATNAANAQPIAFAHWDAKGGGLGNAKNMTISISTSPPIDYCLSGIPFTPRGGQVTMDATGFLGGDMATFALGKRPNCPAGSQAWVEIQLGGGGGPTDDSFFVTVYG